MPNQQAWWKGFLSGIGWNGFGAIAKAGGHIVLNKIIAVGYGAAGLGFFAHFMDLFNMLMLLPQQGINKAIVKHLSEEQYAPRNYLSAANRIALLLATATFLLICFLHIADNSWLGSFIADMSVSTLWWWVVFLLCTAVYIKQQVLLSFLQAKQNFKAYSLTGVVGTFAGIAGLYIAMPYGLQWAALGFLIGLASSILVIPHFTASRPSPTLSQPSSDIGTVSIAIFAPYVLFALASLLSKSALYGIRSFSLEKIGAVETGYWQLPFTISQYLTVAFSSVFLVVFYPKITKLAGQPKQFWQLILRTLAVMLPLIIIGLWSFYLLKEWLVVALFSEALSPSARLFSIHLWGDFFMLMNHIGVYIWLALGKSKLLIAQQLISSAVQIATVYLLFPNLGIQSFPASHLASQLVGALIVWGGFVYYKPTMQSYP